MRRVVVLLLIVSLALAGLGAVISGTPNGDAHGPAPDGADGAVRDFYRTQDVLWVHGDATGSDPAHEDMLRVREAVTDSGYEIVTASTTVDSLRTDRRTGDLHAVVTTAWTLRDLEAGALTQSSMTDEWRLVLQGTGPSTRVVRTVFVPPAPPEQGSGGATADPDERASSEQVPVPTGSTAGGG